LVTLTSAALLACVIPPAYVVEAVPPLTKNVAADAPLRAPPPKFDVPVTVVRLTPLVPPDELIAEKFALSATALAMIAAAACVVLLIVPVPLVTFTVPPIVALKPVPPLVWMLSELKVIVAPAVPAQLTPVVAAVSEVALVAAWKLITFVPVGELTETALPLLLNVAAPLTVTLPPPAPCRKALPVPPETPSVPKVSTCPAFALF